MARIRPACAALAACLILFALSATGALAAGPNGAVISNGTVQLGVNSDGSLNYDCASEVDPVCPEPSPSTGIVGLRYVPFNLESTAPGCLCEGWGVADAGSGLTGSANQEIGAANLTLDSFTAPTASRAIATVDISDPTVPGYGMRVVHDYQPSGLSSNLYEATVTITNTGTSAITDLRYRRAMDWDIDPTAFDEWVTNQGTSPQLLFSSDDGFAPTDPLAGPSYVESEAVCGAGYTGACQFTDLGAGGTYPTATSPSDHGGLFDFGFGSLPVGESKTFKVYYGAAPSETAAVAALTAGGAQVYSLGESNCGGNTVETCGETGTAGVTEGKPATFMFGFVTTTGDLSITKSDSPDPVQMGQNLSYTITVNNNGPQAAAGVQVTDALPAGVDFVSATPSQGSCSGTATVTCNLGAISNNGSAQVQLVVKPTSVGSGTLSNTATVASASADANQANNSDTETTTIQPAGPTLSIDDVTITEGNSGTKNAVFTVSLSQMSGSAVGFNYATEDGSATQPADYSNTSGSGSIAAGSTSTTVSVPIAGDTLDEDDETFKVKLSNATGAAITDAEGLGTITDDDSPPSLSIGDVTVTEGNAGGTAATFTVSLSAASGRAISVGYATSNGSARSPADYGSASGTLNFAAGQTSTTVTVTVAGDTIDEDDETFGVGLSGPTNATIGDGQGSGAIVDDDGPPALSIGDVTVTEGASGTIAATFTVSLSAASEKVVSVSYASADGSAVTSADYDSTAGGLTFAAGQTAATLSVPVRGDMLDEPDETFAVALSGAVNSTVADGQGTGTIVDDDPPPLGGTEVPPVIDIDRLCGVTRRGYCNGLQGVTNLRQAPGNAVWSLRGKFIDIGKPRSSRNTALALSRTGKSITKPGRVKFKLGIRKRTFLKARALLGRSRKGVLLLRTTYTSGGQTTTQLRQIKLKR